MFRARARNWRSGPDARLRPAISSSVNPVGHGRHQHIAILHRDGKAVRGYSGTSSAFSTNVEQFAHPRLDLRHQMAGDDNAGTLDRGGCGLSGMINRLMPVGPHRGQGVMLQVLLETRTRERLSRVAMMGISRLCRVRPVLGFGLCDCLQSGAVRRIAKSPNWASLRFMTRCDMRVGPSEEYPDRMGPTSAKGPAGVKVVRVREGWRFVEDPEGATGWIRRSQLDPQRGALVVGKGLADIRAQPASGIGAALAGRAGGGGRQARPAAGEGWCEIEVAGRGAGWCASRCGVPKACRATSNPASGRPCSAVNRSEDRGGSTGSGGGGGGGGAWARASHPAVAPCAQQRQHQREQILARRDHTSALRPPPRSPHRRRCTAKATPRVFSVALERMQQGDDDASRRLPRLG